MDLLLSRILPLVSIPATRPSQLPPTSQHPPHLKTNLFPGVSPANIRFSHNTLAVITCLESGRLKRLRKTLVKALSFGAVLWDIIDGQEFIGGAPFNLAAHLAQCDVEAFLLTRIGQDRLGENALREISRFKVNPQWIQIDLRRPTGWAKVTMDSKGQPSYQFPDDPAHLFIEPDTSMMHSLRRENFDVFCFGTLEQKEEVARRTLKNLITTLDCRHIFYDINIRLDFYPQPILRQSLDQSTIVKLNLEELQMVTERLYGKALEERQFAEQLFGDHAVDVVCITKGSCGCSVHTQN